MEGDCHSRNLRDRNDKKEGVFQWSPFCGPATKIDITTQLLKVYHIDKINFL